MKKILLFFVLLTVSLAGFSAIPGIETALTPLGNSLSEMNMPPADPTLTGPTSVCLNSTNNIYETDAGQTAYVWTINGGTITAGGNSASNTATVTWTTAGSKSISVSYAGSNTTTLPVTVNPLTASVSIVASANPVTNGTSVTFTATPVNGGASPVYEWKVNNVTSGTNSPTYAYIPANGDVIYCFMTSNAPCVTGISTSNVVTMTVTYQPVSVILPTVTALPTQTVNIPVKLVGAGSSGTPISGANLHIKYDSTKLAYVGLTNFYSSMPSSQWFYSDGFDADCSNHAVVANWAEPSAGTIAVPDSTTLFMIQFTYIGGDCPLEFCVNEFTDVNIQLLTVNAINGAVNEPPTPSLTGAASVCEGSSDHVYTTDPGQTNYVWNIVGGMITSGGTGASNTATVTWTTIGSQSISVSYTGSTTATLPVAVNAGKTLTIKAFLEGLYAGSGMMNQAYDENGPHFGPGIADQVTVELHSEFSYPTIEFSDVFELETDGDIVVNTIPCTLSGNYYITIKHRNSIETISATAVAFNGSTINYDFTTGLTQAFADNMKDNGNGEFSIWTGDVNQDGLVDSGDLNPVDNASTIVTFGYVVEDINGDGIVDSGDMNYVDNNSTAIIIAYTP